VPVIPPVGEMPVVLLLTTIVLTDATTDVVWTTVVTEVAEVVEVLSVVGAADEITELEEAAAELEEAAAELEEAAAELEEAAAELEEAAAELEEAAAELAAAVLAAAGVVVGAAGVVVGAADSIAGVVVIGGGKLEVNELPIGATPETEVLEDTSERTGGTDVAAADVLTMGVVDIIAEVEIIELDDIVMVEEEEEVKLDPIGLAGPVVDELAADVGPKPSVATAAIETAKSANALIEGPAGRQFSIPGHCALYTGLAARWAMSSCTGNP